MSKNKYHRTKEGKMAKKGLWYNIQQKRKRIAEGSGEKMRKPGSKGAPTAKALKVSQAYTGKAIQQPTETSKEFKTRHAYHTPFMKQKPKDAYMGKFINLDVGDQNLSNPSYQAYYKDLLK